MFPAYSTAERSSPIPPAPDSQLTSPAGSTPLSPSTARSHPVPPSLAQPNMEEEADRLAVVRGIWERSCGHLEPEQQEELWQLLTEFKGIFALTDAEIGRTHLVHHQIDTGAPGLSDHHPAAFPWRTEKLQNLSLPFVLDTDASNVGMGAVLSQTRPSQRPHRETVFWPPPGPDVHVVRGECTVVHQQTGPPPLFRAHQNHSLCPLCVTAIAPPGHCLSRSSSSSPSI
ncbi:hypothetical protein AAFF_G00014500 [Aldrovandia affinis]|uniref:Reverse transcriptase/retrotransposon-derived protein RNase H-like domain-containing protein n=1 Tax=Aldrovandia affinis TaxID=143900 RepID=A0AAD7R2Z3_9TELE|nr:hypothetical protein AAFF_G00014500 [Aldrovandia affinis]